MAGLKPVYKAETIDAAETALDELAEKWPNLSVYFKYPADIRRVIYTTNAPSHGLFHKPLPFA
jgi:transposase-like protein